MLRGKKGTFDIMSILPRTKNKRLAHLSPMNKDLIHASMVNRMLTVYHGAVGFKAIFRCSPYFPML